MIYVNSRFLTQQITGVQRFAIEISLKLSKLRNDLVFVTPSNILHFDLANELNAKIIGTKHGHLWEQIDLVDHLKNSNSPLLVNFCNTAPLNYKNQIVTIHDLAFLYSPKWFSLPFRTFYKFLIPRIAKRSRRIIAVSEFSKKEIINHLTVDESKIAIISNAVKVVEIESNSNEVSFGDEKFILSVGSLDPRKNLSTLISAFKKLAPDEYKLYIVGGSSKAFKSLNLKEEKNIKILGRVSDSTLTQLYQKAQLFIYISLYEGFGIPPLEAMYHKCPVIVSNIGSLKEVCSDAAIYVDPLNEADIVDKITLLWNDNVLRQNIINEGLKISSKYNWSSSASKLSLLLEKMVI